MSTTIAVVTKVAPATVLYKPIHAAAPFVCSHLQPPDTFQILQAVRHSLENSVEYFVTELENLVKISRQFLYDLPR